MNKDKRNNIQLLGTLNNADESGIIANANQIYDANEDKSTQDVSKEHTERIKTLEDKENELIAAVGTGGSVDTRITNAVNTEKTRAEGAESTIDSKITAEQTRATNAENALDVRVDTLEEAVGTGDSVDTRINNASKIVLYALDAEKTRAKKAESTLDGKITAEQTRAANAENALGGRVDTLEEAVGTGDSVDSRIASAVAAETSRAQEAEANRYTKNETYTKEEVNNLINTNSFWDSEEKEEFNIIDKKGRKGLSVGKNGVKARAYNIVDENGNIINTIRKLDEEPTASSKNPVTSECLFSNSFWNLEESEEFNVVDKNNKKVFSVGKDGVKARAYNVVDKNGDIISTIGENDKLGDGGFFQEKKGTYYFPSSISSSDSGLSYAVVGNEAKFKKSIKVEVSGITPTSDTYWADRGALTINFDNPIKVKQTLSLWYFVPSKYWKQDYRGGDSNICLDRFHLYFYNGDTQIYNKYISLYEYHCGWNLFKFLTDDLVNTIITKVEVRFYSYNNHPNFVCYLGHFVADQRMTPILNFNMDGRLDGITYTSGFAQWLMDNNMPVDLRLYGFGNYEEGEDGWKTITRKMYFSGLANGMTYSGEAKNYTLQQAITYLKTGDVIHGREAALYDIPAVRDIILCGASHNFVDDELLLAAKLAGYKMIRDASSYSYTSYIDSQCCVMPTYGVCGITDVTLSGEALDADIAAKVSKAKSMIDTLIKYGMAMSMFTHQVASKTQQGESDFNTLASYAEGVEEIFSYALQKQSEGKLLIKSMYNIINNN